MNFYGFAFNTAQWQPLQEAIMLAATGNNHK
jgi:hypothetical protein